MEAVEVDESTMEKLKLNSPSGSDGVQIHQFESKISEERVCFQVTNLGRSVYIWIGSSHGRMDDLSLASATPYDHSKVLPTTTKIIGNSGDNSSEALASKLSKRLKKPVLLSLNLNLQAPFWTDMEKALFEEISLRPQHFL